MRNKEENAIEKKKTEKREEEIAKIAKCIMAVVS